MGGGGGVGRLEGGYCTREGGRFDQEPSYCIRNTGDSQNLFRATPIIFEATIMLSSEPLNLKSMKNCFRSYLILKANSDDYHDGVHFVAKCKF